MAATQNANRSLTGAGQLYIIDYPVYAGGTYTLVRDSIASNFINLDLGTLKAGLTPYAVLNQDGLGVKISEEVVEFTPNLGPKKVLGTVSFSSEGEFTFIDSDLAHFKDAFSSTASQSKTVSAAVGKVGYSLSAFGGTSVKKLYALAYLSPSIVPNTLDALIYPRVKFSVDTDLKMNSRNPQILKLKVFAESENLLINPDTLLPELFVKYQVDAAPLP